RPDCVLSRAAGGLTSRALLVGRGSPHAVDDHDIDRCARGFQLEAKLFLHGNKDRRSVWICSGTIGRLADARGFCVSHLEIKPSGELRAIDDQTIDDLEQARSDPGHEHTVSKDVARTKAQATSDQLASNEVLALHALSRTWPKLRAKRASTAGADQRIDRQGALFEMRFQREPILEQRPHHQRSL